MAITYDDTMSDAEALMWRMEKDPFLSSTFAAVTLLDRAPDFELFRRRMIGAALKIPRLRQVVRSSPGNLAPPRWVFDSDFDIDRHVRRVALPSPGDDRQLFDLATTITADPFDRVRPLWQFTIVEGLSGRRAALVQKMHHTIADGESGVRISLEFLDFERDAIPPELPDEDEIAEAEEESDDESGAADVLRDIVNASLRIPLGVAQQVRELLADPAQIPDAGNSAIRSMLGVADTLGETDRARSPLWTERSLGRHFEAASIPFAETKSAATALGGTLNTAFVTIATEAVARYHSELGAPVESLRASMAISTRTADSGANAFSLARMLVPTGDMGIDERFRAIDEATRAAVEANESASLDTLAAVAVTLPTSLICRLARQQSQPVDFATSNVRGSKDPVYCAGAQLLSNHPIGPLSGVAFNLTLLSYLGKLDLWLNTDTAAVKEPEMLRRLILEAAHALAAFAE